MVFKSLYKNLFFFFNNARNTKYFIKIFTNCWCDEWLLENKKVILIVGLYEKQ